MSFSLKKDFPKFKDCLFLESAVTPNIIRDSVFVLFSFASNALAEFILKNANGVYLFCFPFVNVCFKAVSRSLETFTFFNCVKVRFIAIVSEIY